MGFWRREAYSRAGLGAAVTLSGTNESARVASSVNVSAAVRSRYSISERFSLNEVWIPVGVAWICTTSITVTVPTVQILRNGVAPTGPGASPGIATLAIVTNGPNETFAPFTDYIHGSQAGDVWSVKVVTTSTAGAATFTLVYATKAVAGVTEGVGD